MQEGPGNQKIRTFVASKIYLAHISTLHPSITRAVRLFIFFELFLETKLNIMKQTVTIFFLLLCTNQVIAQSSKEDVSKACLNYIEGFYEGDTVKLAKCLMPSLFKFGYWKDKTSGKYNSDGNMTYRQAMDYAKKVFEKKHFAKADAPRKVEVLDIQHTIASAKVTAWWGIDYILLSKQNDTWMIEQVLWEGPLQK